MAEYEALLLGLKLVKNIGAAKISILGDSDLIIQQMKGNFVTNDLRLRAYRGAAIEIINTLSDHQLTKISRKHNLHAHSLPTFEIHSKNMIGAIIPASYILLTSFSIRGSRTGFTLLSFV